MKGKSLPVVQGDIQQLGEDLQTLVPHTANIKNQVSPS